MHRTILLLLAAILWTATPVSARADEVEVCRDSTFRSLMLPRKHLEFLKQPSTDPAAGFYRGVIPFHSGSTCVVFAIPGRTAPDVAGIYGWSLATNMQSSFPSGYFDAETVAAFNKAGSRITYPFPATSDGKGFTIATSACRTGMEVIISENGGSLNVKCGTVPPTLIKKVENAVADLGLQ